MLPRFRPVRRLHSFATALHFVICGVGARWTYASELEAEGCELVWSASNAEVMVEEGDTR